jgi:hypothetical protein
MSEQSFSVGDVVGIEYDHDHPEYTNCVGTVMMVAPLERTTHPYCVTFTVEATGDRVWRWYRSRDLSLYWRAQ